MKFFLTLLPLLAFAAPQGLHVMSGNAEVVGHEVRVTESSVLHWDSYSIDHHEHIHYPATHATVNRVIGNDISKIHGRLSSNGPLWLINPNGIVIGENGRINAASFLASTLDLLDGPEFVFAGDRGCIEQHGVIECPGGYVTLLSAESVVQTGEIHAEKVAIGVGREILFTPKDSPLIAIRQSGLEKPGFAAGIQCKGLIEATGFEERGGEVYLVADRIVVEKETMLRGNDVRVLGKEVAEFYGEIEAPGGFAEVSGKELKYRGKADLRAEDGTFGTLLLDPTNIEISTTNTGGMFTACAYIPSGDSNTISADDLADLLQTCHVTIDTASGALQAGTITVSNPIGTAMHPWDEATTLTLIANQNIAINAAIENTSAMTGFTAMDFTANGVPSGAYHGIAVNGVAVASDGGDILMVATGGTSAANGILVTGASGGITSQNGNIDLTGNSRAGGNIGFLLQSSAKINSTGNGDIVLVGTSQAGNGVGIFSSGFVESTNGDISITGTVLGTSLTLRGIFLSTSNAFRSTSGNITLNGINNSTGVDSHGISMGNQTTGTSGLVEIMGTPGSDPTSVAIFLSGNLTSSGAIAFDDPVLLGGGATRAVTGSGTVTFASSVDATTAGVEGLTVNAGAGEILLQGELGGTTELGPVSLTTTTTAAATTIGQPVTASSFSLTASRGIVISAAVDCSGLSGVSLTNVGGVSASYNGIRIDAALTTTGGPISLSGVGGTGGGNRGVSVAATGSVTSNGGDITFHDCMGGTTTSNSCYGVYVGASIDAGAGAVVFDTIEAGSGGTTGATSHVAVFFDAGTITGSTIEMTGLVGGHGGAGATSVSQNYGFFMDTGATLGSATTTSISITATGGSGEGATSFNDGINLAGGTIQTDSTTGTLTLMGTGGGNPLLSGTASRGINFANATTITTGPSITLTGVGGSGNGVTGNEYGVLVTAAQTLTLGGMNPQVEFLNCQGGNGGTGNVGVQFNAGFDVGSAALHFTDCHGGTGGTSGATVHYGVYCAGGVVTGSTIEMTGLVGGHGATGATAVTSNYGFLVSSGTLGSASTTSISIEAAGGSGEGATSNNYGIILSNGTIQTHPTNGTVTLTGAGGGDPLLNGNTNDGIFFANATTSTITTGTSMMTGKSLVLTGNGGSGSGGSHSGVRVGSGAVMVLTIGGVNPEVEFLNCQGGNGGSNNRGVQFAAGFDAGAATGVALKFTDCHGGTGGTSGSTAHYGVYCDGGTVTGATIEMTGIVGGQGAAGATAVSSNRGFIIDAGAQLGTTSTTSISITATGGSGEGVTSSNYGVNIAGGTLQTNTTTGTITLTGTGGGNPALGGSNNHGIFGGTAILSTGTTLTLTGMGGQGSGGVQNGATIPASSTMTVTLGGMNPTVQFLNCHGGDGGTGNRGVIFDSGFDVGSAALHFIDCHGGTGGTSASTLHHGVYCNTGTVTGATIEMTGIVGGHGAAGATNVSNNYGFHIDTGATLGTTSGMHPTTSIIIEATGGNGEGTTSGNIGIRLAGGTVQVHPTTGAISLTGTGGGDPLLGGASNRGIATESSATTIITGTSMEGKSLTLTGMGGAGNGGQHYGVYIAAAPMLTLGGTDPVVEFFECRGGTGGSTNVGARFDASFDAGAALLKLTDCRGGSGASSLGIWTVLGTINAGSVIMEGTAIDSSSDAIGILLARPLTAAGSITLNGTSLATGTASHGISITLSWTTSSSGLLQMTGSSASAFDINLGADITHSGAFTCHSPLRISGTTRTITSAGATTFADTIDAVTTGGLTLSAGSGLIALEGALGSLVPLGPVSLTTSHTTDVELHANATASSFTTTGTTKMKLFQTATTIDTTGAISFGGTVDGDTAGMQSLTLNAGSTITIGGIVGGTTGLGTFEATASNVLLNADITATEGTFDADVTVTGDPSLKKSSP